MNDRTKESGSQTQSDWPTYRIAFVNTHPIQYFAPLYAYLTRYCGLYTTALYLSDFSLKGGQDPGFGRAVTWDVDLLDGYEAKFMGGEKASRRRVGGFFSMVAPQLWSEIRQGAYDAVIVHGHNLAAHHIAQAACIASGTPVFSRGETHLRLARPGWRKALRKPLLKMHYRGFDGFLAIGSANAAYYRSMGISADKIFHVPYTVENTRFIAAGVTVSADRGATRAKLGMDPNLPAIIYASKFDRRKHPDDLLAAYSKLRSDGVAAQLVLVGTGVLEDTLKRHVLDASIPDVIFPGFVNQAELPSVYAASDVFVLPSSNEPWGLVVNEAMCAGLPIVLSEEIGCADDLVRNGVNGATFAAGDVDGLMNALRPILTDAKLRAAMGQASLERIRSWSYAECGTGIRAAIEATRAQRRL
ncbi:MAG: glycosyl transferase family 1 [Rhodobacter sp. CACIA14H1]|nr:MAG: glycosyl transferase family 1 [Rhodobacter sp. CACIA14H1]